MPKKETRKQVTPPELRNPTGKGGFGDNPQNKASGRWKKEESISYNINKFMRLVESEFEDYPKNNNMTIAEKIAWERLSKARELLTEAVFVTDRTEGKPKESVEFSGEINTEQRVPTEAEQKAALAYIKELDKYTDDY